MENTLVNGRLLEKELFIKASPARVFQALTNKADIERWFLVKADLDPRPGGAIRFEWGPGMVNTGTVLTFEPPHLLRYTWEKMEPTPTTITFELTPENNGTLLRLTHSGIGEGEDWDNYYSSVNGGWTAHLNDLTSWLETGNCPPPGPRG